MSSSDGPALQRRSPLVHTIQGNALKKVCFPRSKDIDLRQTYPKPRRIDNQPPVPTAATLPLVQPKRFTHRDGVHLPQDYRPTAFPMKVSAPRETQPQPDRVVQGVTKVIGKENRRGWKTPRHTRKTNQVRARADRWIQKNGHLVKTR